MIKRHWPIVFTALMVIISIVLWIAAANSTDTGYAILAGLVIFMVLLPLSGAVLGGWYGWRIRSPRKWLLAPAAFLGTGLLLLAADLISGSGTVEIGSCALIGALTGAACLAAEAIAGAVFRLVRKTKADRNGETENETHTG